MNITQIEKTIAALSLDAGYTPLIVSEEELEITITSFPVAWIQLPKVLFVEGREQGVIGHQITVALMDDCQNQSIEDKRARLTAMQEDLLEIITQVSLYEGVVEVTDMTITPRLTHATRHGDVAQICKGKIVSYF